MTQNQNIKENVYSYIHLVQYNNCEGIIILNDFYMQLSNNIKFTAAPQQLFSFGGRAHNADLPIILKYRAGLGIGKENKYGQRRPASPLPPYLKAGCIR